MDMDGTSACVAYAGRRRGRPSCCLSAATLVAVIASSTVAIGIGTDINAENVSLERRRYLRQNGRNHDTFDSVGPISLRPTSSAAWSITPNVSDDPTYFPAPEPTIDYTPDATEMPTTALDTELPTQMPTGVSLGHETECEARTTCETCLDPTTSVSTCTWVPETKECFNSCPGPDFPLLSWSCITDNPSRCPVYVPPTASHSTSVPNQSPTLQPTCTVCTNISPDRMKTCARTKLDDNKKCMYDEEWVAESFCQYSCYIAGQGYSDDVVCCDTAEPTPSPSPMPTTGRPSFTPTPAPSKLPTTDKPSRTPTSAPTQPPTQQPTQQPTHKSCDTGRLSNDNTDVTFPIRSSFDGRSFPCYKSESSSDPIRGVYYVKIPKTDSAYWKAVGVRTIFRMETSVFDNKECSFLGGHNTAFSLNLKDRVPDQTFAYTFIRNPKDFAVRRFYFRKSVAGGSTHADAFLDYLRKDINTNEQAKYIVQEKLDVSDPVAAAKQIVASYDFIGLVEESAKSLVLMQLLLGLTKFDILYYKSDLAGSITYFHDDNGRCGKVINESTPQKVEEYIDSKDWYRDNAIEVELYKEVQKTIEASIDQIGREKFDETLCEHKSLINEFQSFAKSQCDIRCEYY